MTRWLPLAALAALTGCIIYETDGSWTDRWDCDGDDCQTDWWDDPCGGGTDDTGGPSFTCTPGDTGTPGTTTGATGTGTGAGTGTGTGAGTGTGTGGTATGTTPAPTPDFFFDPADACIGETVIAWVLADQAGWDHTNIAAVQFVGDVNLLQLIPEPDEALMLLSIPADADPGRAEALLTLTDGTVTLVDGGLTLVDCDAGTGAGTGTGSGTGTGTGTGAGTGTGTGTGTGCPTTGTGTGSGTGTGTGGETCPTGPGTCGC